MCLSLLGFVNNLVSLAESNFCDYLLVRMEKAIATHSSTLAWRIPGMGEPGGLPSVGLHRVRHD